MTFPSYIHFIRGFFLKTAYIEFIIHWISVIKKIKEDISISLVIRFEFRNPLKTPGIKSSWVSCDRYPSNETLTNARGMSCCRNTVLGPVKAHGREHVCMYVGIWAEVVLREAS